MYFPQFGVLDLSLLRRSFDADPISPLQPQAAYYVTRNLATMLDELEPAEFEYTIDQALSNLEAFAMKSPGGPVLALWLGGRLETDVKACQSTYVCRSPPLARRPPTIPSMAWPRN